MLQRGRSAGNVIRKWQEADEKTDHKLLREIDRFSEISRLRTDGSARIDWDGETERFTADAQPEAVRHDASKCSLCLTFLAVGFFVVLFVEVWAQFAAQDPSINEFTTEAIGGNAGVVAEHPIPDTALTIVLPNKPEGEALKYVWPEFGWGEIRNGFTSRGGNFTSGVEPRYGVSGCGLDGGYEKDSSGQDSGSARWPVFCVSAADVETAVAKARANVTQAERQFFDISTQLSGRFGDPRYTFLSIKLMRCGHTDPEIGLTPGLKRLFDEEGGGECATQSELDVLGEDNAWQYPVDVWFKFKRENWTVPEDSSESAYERGELQYQRGPLAGTNTNPCATAPPRACAAAALACLKHGWACAARTPLGIGSCTRRLR